MRGHLGPACNAVGYVDRQVWGVNHLYSQPVWARLKVSIHHMWPWFWPQQLCLFAIFYNIKDLKTTMMRLLSRMQFKTLNYLGRAWFIFYLQACTFSSPSTGPFRKDAPSWCLAPFEPEGLLRFAVHFYFLLYMSKKLKLILKLNPNISQKNHWTPILRRPCNLCPLETVTNCRCLRYLQQKWCLQIKLILDWLVLILKKYLPKSSIHSDVDHISSKRGLESLKPEIFL